MSVRTIESSEINIKDLILLTPESSGFDMRTVVTETDWQGLETTVKPETIESNLVLLTSASIVYSPKVRSIVDLEQFWPTVRTDYLRSLSGLDILAAQKLKQIRILYPERLQEILIHPSFLEAEISNVLYEAADNPEEGTYSMDLVDLKMAMPQQFPSEFNAEVWHVYQRRLGEWFQHDLDRSLGLLADMRILDPVRWRDLDLPSGLVSGNVARIRDLRAKKEWDALFSKAADIKIVTAKNVQVTAYGLEFDNNSEPIDTDFVLPTKRRF